MTPELDNKERAEMKKMFSQCFNGSEPKRVTDMIRREPIGGATVCLTPKDHAVLAGLFDDGLADDFYFDGRKVHKLNDEAS